jgi:polyribonucleotide nucleotidyltransferase
VIATYGETSVMANVTFAKAAKPGQDFFPLTVHYQENPMPRARCPAASSSGKAGPAKRKS